MPQIGQLPGLSCDDLRVHAAGIELLLFGPSGRTMIVAAGGQQERRATRKCQQQRGESNELAEFPHVL